MDKDNLAQFLTKFDRTYTDRTKPKGLDYIVLDNFSEIFNDVQKDVLLAAKSNAVETTNELCEMLASESARCDSLLYL